MLMKLDSKRVQDLPGKVVKVGQARGIGRLTTLCSVTSIFIGPA